VKHHSAVISKGPVALLVALSMVATAALAASAAAASAPTVTTGAVTTVHPTSVVATGTVNPGGSATTYYFEYGPSTAGGYSSRSASKSAGAGSADVSVKGTISGLSPATSYNYRLVATNAAGTTDGSGGVFNTSAAPTVTTVAASAITASGATFNGIINPEGLRTTWYFQYGLTTAYGSKTTPQTMNPGPNETNVAARATGLTPKSTYHYRLVALSGAGTTIGKDLSLSTDLSVTLNASETSVIYGTFVTLSGLLASGHAGVHVTISSERFDQTTFGAVASVTTSTGGSWSYTAQPNARTTYEATADGGSSSPATVGVRPAVFLVRIAGGQLSTHVVAAPSFAAHVLQLQRLEHGLWVTWKSVRLNGTGKANFSTSLPVGNTAVRMAIGPFVPGIDQAAPGYLAGFSRPMTYHR